MKRIAYIILCQSFLFCFACSPKVWQDSREITPISYRVSELQSGKSVGKLRRLAILPIVFDWNYNIVEGRPSEVDENLYKRALLYRAKYILRGQKGYEVIEPEIYEDVYAEKLGISEDEMGDINNGLTAWAKTSENGALPPESIRSMVSKLGRSLNADGLLVIQGHSHFCNAGFVMTVLTASLAFPVLMICNDYELRADVFEVASGRIVWRNVIHGLDERDLVIESLFFSIEEATPAGAPSK